MGCSDPWTVFLACHKLDILPDNRNRTCSKFGDHAEQGIIVINIESFHVGAHEKSTGDNYLDLNQVHGKCAVPGFQ